MRIVFMGTPDFAEGILQSLIDSEHQVIAVYTQPDRPQGRKAELTPPPVKVLAERAGIPVYQPVRIRRPKWVGLLTEQAPDLIVVAAFGQILPPSILSIAPCINVHASLLPKYRGSSPIQRAIAAGDTETGVTIMRMDEGMDTGNILYRQIVPITAQDTGESLFDKLAAAGQEALVPVLGQFAAGEDPQGIPQDSALATYAPMLSRKDGRLDFTAPAHLLDCHVRAFTPWPSTFTNWEERQVKILQVSVFTEEPVLPGVDPGHVLTREEAGRIGASAEHRILVQTGCGILEILRLQLPGKKPLPADAFLRGYPFWGCRLGSSSADE